MLFRSTAELKKYVSVDAVTEFDSFSPFIQEAESLFILDLLGDALYTALDTDYNDNQGTPADDAHKALLSYVQRSLANYMAFLSVDQMSVNFGDAGVTQSRSENTEPAPRHKTEALKLNFITSGDLHAERLLSYLENTASNSVLNTWYASSSNTISEGRILRTATQASRFVDIGENRRIFKRMMSRIRDVEQGLVAQLIGLDQYELLVSQIKTDSLKDNVASLLLVEKLEPIIAKKALAETLPSIRLNLSDRGLTVFSSNDGVVTKAAASDAQVRALVQQLTDGDTGYLKDVERVRVFLTDFIDNYPLIKASPAYTAKPDPGPGRPPEIDPNAKFVGV